MLTLLLANCAFVPSPRPFVAATATPKPKQFESKTVCITGGTGCVFIVTVRNLGRDRNVKIEMEADAGILFSENHVVSERVYGDYGRYQASQSIPVSLHGYGERQFHFPFYVRDGATLPGVYIIRARLLDADSGEILHQDRPEAFLIRDDNGTTYPVSSAKEFYDHYANYREGGLGFSYRLLLAEGERPTAATLYVMVPSEEENYRPNITITTKGGVTIHHIQADGQEGHGVAQTDHIDAGGRRILVFAIRLDPTDYPVNGKYLFEVSAEAMRDGQWSSGKEDAPVAIYIHSEVDNLHERWLSVTAVPVSDVVSWAPQAIVTSQTIVTPQADQGEMGIGGASELPPPALSPPTPIPSATPSTFDWGDETGYGGRGGGVPCTDLSERLAFYGGNTDILYQQIVVRDGVHIAKFDFDRALRDCGLP